MFGGLSCWSVICNAFYKCGILIASPTSNWPGDGRKQAWYCQSVFGFPLWRPAVWLDVTMVGSVAVEGLSVAGVLCYPLGPAVGSCPRVPGYCDGSSCWQRHSAAPWPLEVRVSDAWRYVGHNTARTAGGCTPWRSWRRCTPAPTGHHLATGFVELRRRWSGIRRSAFLRWRPPVGRKHAACVREILLCLCARRESTWDLGKEDYVWKQDKRKENNRTQGKEK